MFAADYIAALDGYTVIQGGWINRHWVQVPYQLLNCVCGFTYSFVATMIILAIMNRIPGLSLRVSEEAEREGIDDAELGEFSYDYVERTRDYEDVPIVTQNVSAAFNGFGPPPTVA